MQRVSIVFTMLVVALLGVASLLFADSEQDADDKQRFSYSKIGSTILIDGDLGCPIGTGVKIQGYKQANGPLSNWFWVEIIDGKPLDSKRGVLVNGISKWKDGTKATLTGHETGLLKFRSLNESNYGNDDPRWNGPYQVIDLTFDVDHILQPLGLELDKEEDEQRNARELRVARFMMVSHLAATA
jgi:hypothetical protein